MGEVGETGGPSGGDGGTNGNKQGPVVYARDVHPAMLKCSGGACHNIDAASGALGKFYAADASAGYAKLSQSPTIIGAGTQSFSSVAPILTHIAAGHKAIVYSPDEITKITNWLAIETSEKDGTTPTDPPVDPKAVLRTFSACLTLGDFNTAQMAQKWSALAANNNQKCLNCHQGGGDGFIVNSDPEIMFRVMSESSAYMLKFFSVDTSVTPARVTVNTGAMTNAGVMIANHPRFNPTVNAGMTALGEFYDLASAKLAAGACGPTPTLKD